MLRTLAAASIIAVSGSAFAQSRSSFFDADGFIDISITQTGPETWEVAVGAAPQLVFNGDVYLLTDVFGFWVLSDDVDVIGSTSSFGLWSAHQNNSGTGGILGWKTNPNTGITPGNAQSFTFDSLDASTVDRFGLHVRADSDFPFGGNTAYFTFTEIPAPGVASLFGLAAVASLRRRR